MIRYELPALRLAEALQASLLDAGMNPVLRVAMTPRMEKQFYVKANEKQLVFQPPGEKELYQKLNGGIYLHAPDSLTHLADVDSRKIGKATVATKVPERHFGSERGNRASSAGPSAFFPPLNWQNRQNSQWLATPNR